MGPVYPKAIFRPETPKHHSFGIQKFFHVKLHKIFASNEPLFVKFEWFLPKSWMFISRNGKKSSYILSISKDGYYSVKIDGYDTCYPKFLCNSKLLKFHVLPNGLSPGPWKFTKPTKPPLAMLGMKGYTVAIYIDGIITIDQSFEECLLTVVETINLFQKLGFAIHLDKSKFMPAKIVKHLGFIIDSEKMLTYLLDQKKQKNYEKCCIIPVKPKLTTREFVSFIGTLTFPGNQFDSLSCIFQIVKICMLTFLLSFSQAANSAKVAKIWRFQNANQVVLLHFALNKKLM